MVTVYEFNDIEYRTLDWTRGVAGVGDGSGDTGVEGVEPFLRREEAVVVPTSVLSDALFGGAIRILRK
jgi:hypothetical protein